MNDPAFPFRLNPSLDGGALTAAFARDQHVQIPDLLTEDCAGALAKMLIERTPWGMTWQAGDDGPHRFKHDEMRSIGPAQQQDIMAKLHRAMQGPDFAFIYSQYRVSKAVEEGWSISPDHDRLLMELNSPNFLDFIRQVTSLPQIRGCDAQVSHYGPNQFLSLHQDISTEPGEDRLVAYVLNLCVGGWRPDWGGYLMIYDERGDIVRGYMPRFNCLNMFRVPRDHSVSYVPPFAVGTRLAVTGWFRS